MKMPVFPACAMILLTGALSAPVLAGEGSLLDRLRTRDRPAGEAAVAPSDTGGSLPPDNLPPRMIEEPPLGAATVGGEPEVLPEMARCLSLEDSISLAMQHHPALRLAESRVAAARGAWLQSGLRPNPTLGISGTEINNEGRAGQQGMYVQQQFIRGNKLGLNRAVASQIIEREEVGLTAAELRVTTIVAVTHFKSLLAQERLQLVRQLVTISSELANSTRRLVEAGELPEIDLLQSELEKERMINDRIAAETTLEAALRQLVSAVGLEGLRIEEVCGNALEALPTHEWQKDLDRLLYSSPLLAGQQTRIQQAQWALARARAEQKTDVNVNAVVQYDDATSSPIVSFTVGRPIQIFDWNQGGIRRAQAELIAVQEELGVMRFQLESQLAERYRIFDAAYRQVVRFKDKILPLASRNLELARVGYLAGERNYLELLTAQRTAFQSRLDFLQAVLNAWVAHADMEGLMLAGTSTPLSSAGNSSGDSVRMAKDSDANASAEEALIFLER